MGASCCFKLSSNKVHVESDQVIKKSVVKPVNVQPQTNQQSNKSSANEWDYRNCENWGKNYPDANKSHQSPIDILTDMAIYDESLEKSPIVIQYDSRSFTEISNNGHTFVVSGPYQLSLVSGCCSTNTYQFAQFHMHWGMTDANGSEHLIDGRSCAAEIHFVNWNHVKYSTFKEAAASNNHDGLMVLGVMVIIGEENPEFEKLAQLTTDIKLKNKSARIPSNFDVRQLFPSDLSKYWTYPGSLTTPPCSQSVKWVVLAKPIQISSRQLNKFRGLHSCCDSFECCESNRIGFNFRPVCDLNSRNVYKSFKSLN